MKLSFLAPNTMEEKSIRFLINSFIQSVSQSHSITHSFNDYDNTVIIYVLVSCLKAKTERTAKCDQCDQLEL